MHKTGFVIDARYQDHRTGRSHPERPERISILLDLDKELTQENLVRFAPRAASRDEILLAHGAEYFGTVAASEGCDFLSFDADTRVSALSFQTALLAAGGLLELIDRILTGEIANGFAAVRPPGHHAEVDQAMGFCLFNNVAVAARYLQKRHGLGRILIVDWDVHHGNGTEHTFYNDPSVLYISLHQYPHYPGTGAIEDVGLAQGEGYNLNVALPAGCGDAEYQSAFEQIIEPVAAQFRPEFVLISAGMDCHHRDPLGDMRVTDKGFAWMTRGLMRISDATAGGHCAAVLEGGYDLDGLKEGTRRTIEELCRRDDVPAFVSSTEIDAVLNRIKRVHGKYWEF